MNLFELTRSMVDIESVTPCETKIGDFVFGHLERLARETGGTVERMPVEPGRDNILACWGEPVVTLSTHMDTVPPFIASREDDEFIWGRGSCDAKGILAAMICAAERLVRAGVSGVAVLAVVGEERNSAGARVAARHGRGSRFLINGEPTENRLASGTKGSLRHEVETRGRAAHSAYPHLGESAIDKLLDVLADMRTAVLPRDEVLGAGTLNIGTVRGGVAPNVIAAWAMAEVHTRLVDDGVSTRGIIERAVAGRAEIREILCIPAVRLKTLPGFETAVMAYTTDIPAFAGAWGEPLLIGPGTIHVAHTDEERVPKRQLEQAVDVYEKLCRSLLREAAAG